MASLLAICEALGIAIGSLFEGGDRQLVPAYNASKAAVHHLTRSLAAPGVGRAWVGPEVFELGKAAKPTPGLEPGPLRYE